MILVILGVGILITVLGVILYNNDCDDIALGVIGIIITFVALIVVTFLGVDVSKGKIIDDKIEMYITENTNIQSEISLIIESYKEYESGTYEKFKNESPTILIQLFPELKTDVLVSKQIELYIENNNKIKELQLEKINLKVTKWWLYFGG